MEKFAEFAMAKAGRGDDQYMVRFPEGLRDRIKEAAAEHGRSMNSEIISRLESSFALSDEAPLKPLFFEHPSELTPDEVKKVLEEVNARASRIAFAEVMRMFNATPIKQAEDKDPEA